MKSKKIILGLVLSNFIIGSLFISNATSNSPKPANGDYSLGYGIGDEFEFFCTVFDTTELLNVFGGDWQSNLGYYFWFADYTPPNDLREKAKFFIDDISDLPSNNTWWRIIIDGWGWIAESASYGVPVRVSMLYTIPKIAAGELWNPSGWIISLPVVQYLMGLTYGFGLTLDGNTLIYAGTDVDDFIINWIYDEKTGIVKTFKIKKVDDTVIFEVNSPVSAPSNDEIPGYSLYILISTIVLLIGFVSIVLIKKIKWN